MTRSVVTGANRGIGLEFVRQLLARGDTVEAAVRAPERADELRALEKSAHGRLHIHGCDVASDASVAALSRALGGEPVDLLVNNAGTYGGKRQSVGDMDFADAVATFESNALGPLRVTLALLPNLRKGKGRKVVHLTSGMGSIGDNKSGGFYGYRMSKAALNMASRSLAMDLRDEKIVSVVINPGWVQTDMGGPGAAITAEQSVAAMLKQIDAATLGKSGAFLNWRGGEYEW
jgi:NAD(P)-dependent dehydrogenase (short-subunit alcohol dehydrogenase family)